MTFCDWPVVIPDDLTDEWEAMPESVRENAEALAGRILWSLSGQVYGLCEATVRPCWRPAEGGNTYYGGSGRRAAHWAGLVGDPSATGRCGCGNDCRHAGLDRVPLPGPVHAVTEVRIDGSVVDGNTYRVQQKRWLRRTDGKMWPSHQDLNASEVEAGSFVVTYVRGIEVPVAGQNAAGRLAVELARGITGGPCALPPGVESVSRQGITVQLADMREWFTNGVTGVEEVDLWIMAVNPFKSKAPGRITSPDRPRQAWFLS